MDDFWAKHIGWFYRTDFGLAEPSDEKLEQRTTRADNSQRMLNAIDFGTRMPNYRNRTTTKTILVDDVGLGGFVFLASDTFIWTRSQRKRQE